MPKYVLVTYLRVDGEDDTWMMDSYNEALAEKNQQEEVFPENIYRIEEVADESDREGGHHAEVVGHLLR